jgi:hypothetical protein
MDRGEEKVTATNGTAACYYCTYVEPVESRGTRERASWGGEIRTTGARAEIAVGA